MLNRRTFSMIKPDGVENGYIGAILDKINKAGFKIIALKLTYLTINDAKSFYLHVLSQRASENSKFN